MDIIIFGAGKKGVEIALFAMECKLNVVAFIDNNINLKGKTYCNIEVIHPLDKCLYKINNLPIFIAVIDIHQAVLIRFQLTGLGFSDIYDLWKF